MNKKLIYLDNASNCRMRKEVIKVYKKFIKKKNYSNPSSFHFFGRKSKSYIEISREKISKIINCDPSEIYFTSGGTEGNNLIIKSIIETFNIKNIITSKLEHLSVLNTIFYSKKIKNNIKIFFIKNDNFGNLNLKHFKKILNNTNTNTLVSIMYINNEIGNINNINKIGNIINNNNNNNIFFHSDFVQFIGHFKLNVKKILCNFFTASAHKFYGPFGIGFIYIKKNIILNNFINGGYQERGIRSGTENLYGILALCKALEINNKNFLKDKKKICFLKKKCINLLKKNILNIKFNGLSDNFKKSSFYILNIRLPIKDDLLHIKLDLKGIMISKGSTCNSNKISHVLKNIIKKNKIKKTTSIRISFSIFNNLLDIELFVYELKRIIINNYNNLIKYKKKK
ncbi:MAG: aminotransferase class V-fold PLP-dependent enzyme [Candidatus Shikimatogenerans bostrichidophilus]|nr:MAG: aminotransferase class V-fold PLP-dependent enzyme [Candidatus Shikimatogenerans bostrichidophilus]